jgi:hypothetical protein
MGVQPEVGYQFVRPAEPRDRSDRGQQANGTTMSIPGMVTSLLASGLASASRAISRSTISRISGHRLHHDG